MKIIQILPHSLSPAKLNVDPRLYEGDWHVQIGKKIMEQTKKYSIECWRPEKNMNKKFTRIGNNGILFRIFPSTYYNKRFEYSLSLIRELKRIIKNEQVLIHIHGTYYFHTFFIIMCVGKKIPILVQNHGGLPSKLKFRKSSHPLKFLLFFVSLVERLIFKNIDKFFCMFLEEKEYLSEIYGDERVELQTMGVDFKKFHHIEKEYALKKLNLDKEKKIILFVGRLVKFRGINYLLESIKEIKFFFPNVILFIIGNGPYERELKNISNYLDINNNVIFTGHISNEILPLWYNAADLVISPTLVANFDIVPIEALACETPLVVTNVGNNPKIVRNFEGGYLVPPKDPIAIKNIVIKILNKKKEKINREKGEHSYSWEEIIKNTLNIYDNLFENYYGY